MAVLTPEPIHQLAGADWGVAWQESFNTRTKPGNVEHWSKRAPSFAKSCGQSPYTQDFLDLAQIQEGETVLDFGCGAGTLALPLARLGHHVIACDFSPAMLAELEHTAAEEGLSDLIDTHLVAWEDDWEEHGLTPGCVDVSVASRSIAAEDMEAALLKLDAVARRKSCITVAAGRSPRRDERAFEATGRPRSWIADYVYAMNILIAHDAHPTLSYIISESQPAFSTREEAIEELTDMLGGNLSANEQTKLDEFLDMHYAFDPNAREGREFASDTMRKVRWAFIAWEE